MIQITKSNINDLAEKHYQQLKPSIEKKLKHQGGAVYGFLRKNLELVLKGTPNQLQTEIIEKIPNYPRKTHKRLIEVFNYDNFTKLKRYGAYRLSEKLDVRTCPYCNRLYTFTLDLKSGKTRPEFDHFYDKATYPYLALSFYNLIPSCHICNSNFKGSKTFSVKTHINPYLEGFGNYIKFTIKLNSKRKYMPPEIVDGRGLGLFHGAFKDFSIKLKVDNPSSDLHFRANENIECFKLEQLYNEHKDYVVEIVQKAIVYNNDYINELLKLFPGLFQDRKDVIRMILSNYTCEEDLCKRVLSKLTKDVSEEFGLI